MQIKIIAAGEPISKQSKSGKSYNELEVTYKQDGQTKSKKLMSFTNKDTYNVLLKAQPGEVYEITTEKQGEYWQWIAAAKIEQQASAATQSTGSSNGSGSYAASTGSRYETPEERAARQVSIVRQSSIGAAAKFLASKPKSTEEDLFRLASAIVAFVGGSVFEGLDLPKDKLEDEFDGVTVQ